DDPGTIVDSPQPKPRSLINLEIARPVDDIEFDTNQAKVSLLRVPDKPGVAAKLFGEIASQKVDVDLIIQSIHEGNSNDIAFTVMSPILKKAEAVASAIAPALRTSDDEAEVMVQENIAKVSIVGAGQIGRPGVAAEMFATLARRGINIRMISTSEVKVSCVIDSVDCDEAVAALRETFEIEEESTSPAPSRASSPLSSEPPVRGVALDMKQARLGIRRVPDKPGMAEKIFGTLASHNISVDMIIQSQRCHVVKAIQTRDIAFTVARVDAHAAQELLQKATAECGWGEVVLDMEIAKVSIVGAGMVGQPGIAAKMFESLSEENINIQMITTSEIKISCVVAQDQGVKALKAIHTVFELGGEEEFVVPG
ncbi:MAG: ACT domain-containing protein, partial [Cyanobacteria bacterium J06649_11]